MSISKPIQANIRTKFRYMFRLLWPQSGKAFTRKYKGKETVIKIEVSPLQVALYWYTTVNSTAKRWDCHEMITYRYESLNDGDTL